MSSSKPRKLKSFKDYYLGTLLAAVFLNACITPAPPGPVLEGTLIVYSTSYIYKFSAAPDQGMVNITILSDSASPPELSQDKHSLIFSEAVDQGRRTVLLDLRKGRETILHPLEEASPCSLSPDGRYFSYVVEVEGKRKLYIQSVAADSPILVAEGRSAKYSIGGAPAPYAPVTFGTLTCGIWIGPDRLLFNRTASMPGSKLAGMGDVAPDTTSLAIVTGDSVTLQDAQSVIKLADISDDGSNFLLSCERPMRWCLSRAFRDLEDIGNLNRREVANVYSADKAGFVPNSTELYYVAYEKNRGSRLHLVSLATLEDRPGPGIESLWAFNGIWVGNPQDGVIAVIEQPQSCKADDGECPAQVTLVRLDDLRSRTVLGEIHYSFYTTHDIEILGWLPGE